MRAARCLAAGLLVACGPDAGERVELAPLCCTERAVQVLALRDDEAVAPGDETVVVRDGERWLYGVQRFAAPVANIQETWADASQRSIVQTGARIEGIGRCGEDRQTVAEGLDRIVPRASSDAPWLGYRSDTHELFWFEPSGRWPARRLGRARNPGQLVVRGNTLFTTRADERDFVGVTLAGEGDQVSTQVWIDDVVQDGVPAYPLQRDRPVDAVLLLRGTGELVAFDLAAQRVETVLTGVRSFVGDRDARWIAWTSGDPNDLGDDGGPREAWLLDRVTGQQLPLVLEGEPELTLRMHDRFVMVEGEVDGTTTSTRIVALPGGESIELEGLWWGTGRGSQGEVVALRVLPVESASYGVFAPQQGALVPQAQALRAPTTFWQDALWSREVAADVDDGGASKWMPYDLVRTPLATLQPEVVQRRVWSRVELPGDRWLDVRADDPTQNLGDLVRIDGETGAAEAIDDHVAAALFEPHASTGALPWQTDEVVYQVRALGSGRTGLWRVRFD